MTTTMPVTFRFNATAHEYIDLATGALLPHITGMLQQTGWIDDRWFTEESSLRGQAIHKLTADYDLGALHVASCVSRHRPYLLAHVAAMQIMRPEILAVEEPAVHPILRFGGRPDRVLRAYGLTGVLEVKSGVAARSHAIQTALQAILVSADLNLPPELLARWCLYLKQNGRFKLEEHTQRGDFDEAWRLIRECC
jgi:hypothetical protein